MPPAATPENMSLPVIGQPSVGTAPQSQPPQTTPPAQNGNAMSAGGTSPQLMVN